MPAIANCSSVIHNTRAFPSSSSSHDSIARFLQQNGSSVDSLAQLIRSCRGDLSQTRRVHSYILAGDAYRSDRHLANLLVEMYGKCGSLDEAQRVFDRLERPNIVSWTILMGIYTENREIARARRVFDQMPHKDAVAWNAMIKAYAQLGHLDEAKVVFDRMPDHDVSSWNTLIAAYAQNSSVYEAKQIFDTMPDRNVVSWNAMLAAFAQNGHIHESRKLFNAMPQRDVVSWTAMVTAYAQCGKLPEATAIFDTMPERTLIAFTVLIAVNAQQGHLFQAKLLFDQLPQQDSHTLTAMITAYGQSGDVVRAQRLFDQMPNPNVVSYTALVAAYAQAGDILSARRIFDRIPRRDAAAWNAMVSAYAQNGHLEQAKDFFEKMPSRTVVSWNAMLAALSQYGELVDVEETFSRMPERDTVSWNTMMVAYNQNNKPKSAIFVFKAMDLEGYRVLDTTLAIAIDCCAGSNGLADGKLLHSISIQKRYETTPIVANALIHMYGKCSTLENSKLLFDKMSFKNEVTWNAMISAYAQAGLGSQAMELFHTMGLEGVSPNDITFLGILSASAYGGTLEDACYYFEVLTREYGIAASVDHFTCLIDLLGKAGQLDVAERLIQLMPCKPDAVAWITLLGACKIHGDVARGLRVAARAFNLDPQQKASYLLLSNIYFQAATGRGVNKALANRLLKRTGLELSSSEKKEIG
ncbi:pentatricopeptide repeat-containing protein At4g02750-like [Selaginella moellendorffii]|uniref:pentatricopeptide repeat-containing protein At4g02750-like n=1 Tax=Selaginella moellendorffii TaxID=88036 RepID=UPI000D1CA9F8|nr:pentatricopeptide repeat-containing protein At4g02750-like [Selaginella moellendorffii]|eukprot:XP_024517208.1 pentatricopeptide repeat-containing protein At4g02750-like [Selaginella moellendorffii]